MLPKRFNHIDHTPERTSTTSGGGPPRAFAVTAGRTGTEPCCEITLRRRFANNAQKKGLVADEPFAHLRHRLPNFELLPLISLRRHKPAEQQASGGSVTKQSPDQVSMLVELRRRPDNRHHAIGQREVEQRIDFRI